MISRHSGLQSLVEHLGLIQHLIQAIKTLNESTGSFTHAFAETFSEEQSTHVLYIWGIYMLIIPKILNFQGSVSPP
jgi:hypothetical protein